MNTSAIAVLVVLGVAYAAFALPVINWFITYCDLVAKATGRENERQRFWNTDDGGMNSFEREQLRGLRSGDYLGLTDPKIVALGSKLKRRMRHLLWMGVGLVVTVVVVVEFVLR